MIVTKHTHPGYREQHGGVLPVFYVSKKKYERHREEAERCCPHLSDVQKDAWAVHIARTHPGMRSKKRTAIRAGVIALILTLLTLLLAHVTKAEPRPRITGEHGVMWMPNGLFPQIITPRSPFSFDASSNLKVNCITGCSASAGFTDNTAFTVGSSTINVVGAYFTSGADPACTTGNGCRLRMDASSNLRVNCVIGCAGGSTTPADAFANPTTAGLQFDLLAGFNGTTWDRLRSTTANGLQVDVTRMQGTVGVTQSTSPWVTSGSGQFNVTCTAANCPVNVAQFGGTNAVTGTGASGAGIPRVTVSNDSAVLASGSTTEADAATNPTNAVPDASFLNGFNGTTWDRLRTAGAGNNIASTGLQAQVPYAKFDNSTPSTALTNGNYNSAEADIAGSLLVSSEGRKNSFAAAKGGTVVAGDIAVLPGSATKTIKLTRVEVTCSTSGTPAFADLQLIKRSTADTAGTSAAMTVVPLDSSDTAGTAAPLLYSAAPTNGTSVGAIDMERFNASAIGTANPTPRMIFNYGERSGMQPIVLRGVAQQLAVNVSAVVATGTCNVGFQWTEE